ncbi:MAG TPA: BatD family protein [Dokdonella sp.]|uniref:BatD family protein n=1 Tax=Dokdonella sp. TaxID=2291710 RepID=UPI002D7F3B27|nr:BatD family protein [Dokdonella sp.]HET9032198.1 BatD family protein [Dokdonella sp.]
MMKRGYVIASALLIGLFWSIGASAAARAWLDRDSMQLGETVTLNVESDSSTASEPDFSVLLGDFKSLGTQSSRQISMSNGSTSAKTVWAVGLEPKHPGTLTIPALSVGGTMTEPLSLTVLPAPVGAQGKPGDSLFIEVSADPLSPYVQQQVRYTVKLYFALNLSDGTLDEPAASGAVVQKLGRDKQYSATANGQRYQVLERNYALTPEQSGRLTMPQLNFRGSATDNSDPTGFFRRGRSVTARSDEVQLDVRPKPASWGTAPWLPAASLSLNDESELPHEIQVGEPLTRTIKLRAQGLGFEQLPELEIKAIPGAEVYPDKPDTQTRNDGNWLYGERTRKFAIVPSQPGTLTLPAIEVQWWNTSTDKLETASLPERQINVVGTAASGSTATPSAPQSAPAAPAAKPDTAPTTVLYPSADGGSGLRFWRWISLILAVLWLLTLALWWRSRNTLAIAKTARSHPVQAPGRSVFLRACSMGDLIGAERALVSWARSERAGVRNLGEIAAALEDPIQREVIDDLQRMRYAGVNSEGLGGRLTRAFRGGFSWTKSAVVAAETPALPPLYPEQH